MDARHMCADMLPLPCVLSCGWVCRAAPPNEPLWLALGPHLQRICIVFASACQKKLRRALTMKIFYTVKARLNDGKWTVKAPPSH